MKDTLGTVLATGWLALLAGCSIQSLPLAPVNSNQAPPATVFLSNNVPDTRPTDYESSLSNAITIYNAARHASGPAMSRDGLNLVFSDDFAFFDTSKWSKYEKNTLGDWYPTAGTTWKHDDARVRVDTVNTRLVLEVKKGWAESSEYQCARVDSKMRFQYGLMVARMTLADRTYANTAFWSMPTNVGGLTDDGNDGCEMDFFESPYLGSQIEKIHTAFHWNGYADGSHVALTSPKYTLSGINSGFHYFFVFWTPHDLVVIVDSAKIYQVQRGSNYTAYLSTTNGLLASPLAGENIIPDVPQSLILSTGLNWLQSRDVFTNTANGLVTESQVDFVQVFQIAGWTNEMGN